MPTAVYEYEVFELKNES